MILAGAFALATIGFWLVLRSDRVARSTLPEVVDEAGETLVVQNLLKESGTSVSGAPVYVDIYGLSFDQAFRQVRVSGLERGVILAFSLGAFRGIQDGYGVHVIGWPSNPEQRFPEVRIGDRLLRLNEHFRQPDFSLASVNLLPAGTKSDTSHRVPTRWSFRAVDGGPVASADSVIPDAQITILGGRDDGKQVVAWIDGG